MPVASKHRSPTWDGRPEELAEIFKRFIKKTTDIPKYSEKADGKIEGNKLLKIKELLQALLELRPNLDFTRAAIERALLLLHAWQPIAGLLDVDLSPDDQGRTWQNTTANRLKTMMVHVNKQRHAPTKARWYNLLISTEPEQSAETAGAGAGAEPEGADGPTSKAVGAPGAEAKDEEEDEDEEKEDDEKPDLASSSHQRPQPQLAGAVEARQLVDKQIAPKVDSDDVYVGWCPYTMRAWKAACRNPTNKFIYETVYLLH